MNSGSFNTAPSRAIIYSVTPVRGSIFGANEINFALLIPNGHNVERYTIGGALRCVDPVEKSRIGFSNGFNVTGSCKVGSSSGPSSVDLRKFTQRNSLSDNVAGILVSRWIWDGKNSTLADARMKQNISDFTYLWDGITPWARVNAQFVSETYALRFSFRLKHRPELNNALGTNTPAPGNIEFRMDCNGQCIFSGSSYGLATPVNSQVTVSAGQDSQNTMVYIYDAVDNFLPPVSTSNPSAPFSLVSQNCLNPNPSILTQLVSDYPARVNSFAIDYFPQRNGSAQFFHLQLLQTGACKALPLEGVISPNSLDNTTETVGGALTKMTSVFLLRAPTDTPVAALMDALAVNTKSFEDILGFDNLTLGKGYVLRAWFIPDQTNLYSIRIKNSFGMHLTFSFESSFFKRYVYFFLPRYQIANIFE